MARKNIAEAMKHDEPEVARSTEIELWPIAKLKPHKRNAKLHPPEQVTYLAQLIKRHGFDQPIAVDSKGVIIKGHGRWLAAKELRLATVPVIVRSDLAPGLVAEARIADNRVAEFGWDSAQLVADVVDGLKIGLDPDVIGFSLKDLGLETDPETGEVSQGEEPIDEGAVQAAPVQTIIVEPETPPPPKKPKTKLGQMYQLGDHVLVCGDVREHLPTERVALALHDPPYGISIVEKGLGDGKRHGNAAAPRGKFDPIAGDNEPFDPTPVITHAARTHVLWGANHYADKLPPSAAWIVWDKRVELPSNGFSDAELAWVSKGGSVRIIRHTWNGMIRDSERGEPRVHPTQKPVAVHAMIVEMFTEPGELVFDGYAGSGTTLLACEQLGRKCYTVEKAPAYCDQVIARWEALTGQKAKLIHG